VISGRDALGLVQRALDEAQRRTRDLDERLAEASERLVGLDGQRAAALQELARLRVTQLAASPDTVGRLGEAEAQARALLERRDAEATALRRRLAELDEGAAALAAERSEAADALEAAAEAVDAAEARTQARLAADPGYRAAQEAARTAERIAVHADEKATASERELEAKGAAYRADPLFMYLWRRGYGTSAYRAWPLFRWLDAKVARLVGYADARPNYARLLELPVRLRAHADAVGAQADAQLATLRELDEAARVADGIPALEEVRSAAEDRLANVDGRIEAAGGERRETAAAFEAIAAGEDETTRQAIAFLASAFGRGDLRALRAAALATPGPEDDAVVARLLDLERDREAAAAARSELTQLVTRDRERRADLEDVRRRFKERRYDQPGSTFPDRDLIGTLLTQLLSGAMTRDALWRVLERQNRYRPQRSDPTFGSGGFGRGSPWGRGGSLPRGGFGSGGFGGTGRASGGFKPSGGAIRGGGFKTGGVIGRRGRFKTGGKF
jgi:hypothetical protein